MTNAEWGRKLGLSRRAIVLMGGAKRLEAMTELGRELLLAVSFRQPGVAAVRAAMARIGRADREQRTLKRDADLLLRRREYLLRKVRGVTPDLVWLGHAGLKKPPVGRPVRREEADWRTQGWDPAVMRAMARQERRAG